MFLANFAAHTAVALAAYVLFGGLQLIRAGRTELPATTPEAFTGIRWFTILVLSIWIVGVVVFKLNPGVTAFGAAAILVVGKATDDGSAIASVPWGIILMVSGVSVLIGALLHESSLARTMPTDRILTCRCDTTLVGRGRSSD